MQVDACSLAGPKSCDDVAAFVEFIKEHGPPPGLPPDMLIESTGDIAKDMFLAGVKNRPIQEALRQQPYDLDGIHTALRTAPSSQTDHPAHHSGPTHFLCDALQLVAKLPQQQIRNRGLWRQEPGTGGRCVLFTDNAAERLAAFNSSMRAVEQGAITTGRQLVDHSRALNVALQDKNLGLDDYGKKYVPMRHIRAYMSQYGCVVDFAGVSLSELRDISPDQTDALDAGLCSGKNVSDVEWHGVPPQHWTLWVCLWKGKWLCDRYFSY